MDDCIIIEDLKIANANIKPAIEITKIIMPTSVYSIEYNPSPMNAIAAHKKKATRVKTKICLISTNSYLAVSI